MRNIPFNKPYNFGKEMDYIKNVIAGGKTSGDGEYTSKCQSILEHQLDAHNILMTTSCTHALELALQLIPLQEGDEVSCHLILFLPQLTVFCFKRDAWFFTEVNHDDLCIDVNRIQEKITEKTKVIMVVHYGGNACDMDAIMAIARKYDLYVIEDAAQGFFKYLW